MTQFNVLPYDRLESHYRASLIYLSDYEIIRTYNDELRGLANYYGLAHDVKRKLNRLEHISRYSLFKTLAAKHRSSVTKMALRLKVKDDFVYQYKINGEDKGIKVYKLKDLTPEPKTWEKINLIPDTRIYAGLFIRTLYNLQRVNLGFNQESLLVFKLQPEQGGYKDGRLAQFYQQLFARLDTLPGVRAATFGRVPLIARDNWTNGILLPGEVAETAPRHSTARQMARENYFATLEIPFLRGRGFTAQDDARAPQVAIVNQTFAREFFPNDDVLGKRITFRGDKRVVEIVGVVADAKYTNQRRNIPPLLYTPWQQEGAVIGEMYFSLRTVGEPTALAASIRQLVREFDSNLPVTEVSSQTARSQATLGQELLSARLLSFFGGVALLLAAIGLSGVLAYSVSQRTNEIGIRMALGAPPASVLRLGLWQGLKLVLLGLVIGAAIGYGLKRLLANQSFAPESWQARMANQLYGVSVTDPLTVAAIALLLIMVALLACWIPARRATKVDPMIVLRSE